MENRTEKPSVTEVIENKEFQEALKKAIECGKDTDWGFNGEDEFTYDIFNSEEALQEVIKVLKNYIP